MQVTTNADKVHESLQKYTKEIERKLIEMVAHFAYKVTEVASNNTPIGDQASIDIGMTGKEPFKTYYDYYSARKDKYNIALQVGFHRGAWQYSESEDFKGLFSPDINNASYNPDIVYNKISDSYKLGDTFYIGAIGPGFAALDGTYGATPSSQQAPNGIIAPSISDIMVIYNSDIKGMFERA